MTHWNEIVTGLQDGSVVPYLGPGVLRDMVDHDGKPIPADGEPLILAMTGGRHLNAKLMSEFPRAAMHLELSKGRRFLTQFLDRTYGKSTYRGGAIHQALASLDLPYVVDTNRDVGLQDLWKTKPHTLVVGMARLSANWFRFRIWNYDGSRHHEMQADQVDPSLPILFKPLGTPRPTATFVASDADFVDYITELMGGFAVPSFVKAHRRGKRYLVLGHGLRRDTPRMILTDMIADAAPHAGWILLPHPTAKERRYCESKGLQILEAGLDELLERLGAMSHGGIR